MSSVPVSEVPSKRRGGVQPTVAATYKWWTIRIPPELHEAICREAKARGVPINSQYIWRLQGSPLTGDVAHTLEEPA